MSITTFLRLHQQGTVERMKARISAGEVPNFEIAFDDLLRFCPEAEDEREALRHSWLNGRMRLLLGQTASLLGCKRGEAVKTLLFVWEKEKKDGSKFDVDVSQRLKALAKEKCHH